VGGIVMIVLMTVLVRFVIPRSLESEARARAQAADEGHHHHHHHGTGARRRVPLVARRLQVVLEHPRRGDLRRFAVAQRHALRRRSHFRARPGLDHRS
jgi:hypothetical protein